MTSEPAAAAAGHRGLGISRRALFFIFTLSGISALLYQLIWQRALLTIFGSNIESVTMVVSAFMLGLGIGSIVGGAVSKRPGVPLLLIFAIVEISIGLYGAVSLHLFHWVGESVTGASSLQTGLLTFGLILIPTLLMGSTLPLLVAHYVNATGNVGYSVSMLYFVNTLGAGIGAFLAAFIVLGWLGLSGSVYVAVTFNVLAGLIILYCRRAREAVNPRFLAALGLVALTGFISLSYEICWVRLYSFLTASRAWAFGAMLGTYLIGLALGSLWSLRFQDAKDGANPKHLRTLALFVLAANAVGFLVVPTVSWLATVIPVDSVESPQGPLLALATLPLIALAAALLGATLPLICHFAIPPDDKAGARLSYLYLANILGSGAGSLLTGFVLMDRLSMQQLSVFLACLGLVLSAGLAVYSGLRGGELGKRIGVAAAAGIAIFLAAPQLFDGLYERLQMKSEYQHAERFDLVVESRFGVVTVDKNHLIYGGGIFDGLISTDLSPGSWMVRPYFLSAVHPAPKEVLVIGLSGGTWTQILAHHPDVEKVTAVEINAAYSERVIPRYDAVKSLLDNPKVEIVIDDGRRWLRNNPDKKFDAIVANATLHWREHASSLLSKEFMQQVHDHLKPGGVYLFNTTGSDRAAKTALQVFPDCALLLNNILASNAPLEYDKDRWRKTLTAYSYDGVPLFDTTTQQGRDDIEEIISMLDTIGDTEVEAARRIWTREVLLNHPGTKKARPITDDNLGHEFWYH